MTQSVSQGEQPNVSPVVLRMEGVSRYFGAHAAVDGVSFELHKGEVLTLLGPSGCGKTTTLRMAIGLERVSSGRVLYGSRVIDAPAERIFVSPEDRDMGMVFQSYAIWPHMNVFENVAFPLRTRGTPKSTIDSKVNEILTHVGLAGFAARPGMHLSGGQQQRVAVARGLVANPDVLLMDEPFSNLDAKLRDRLRTELRVLQRRLNISILFVTHDQTEALALSDRIAVMRDGKIEQIGPPIELYTHPETPFVRDFLGQSVLVRARIVESGAGGTRVRLGDGTQLVSHGRNHLANAVTDAKCLLSVRPEEIRIVPAAMNGAANTVAGTIRHLLFLGQYYEAIIDLPRGQEAQMHLGREATWHEGQQIHLQFPKEHVQIWDRQ